MTVTTVPDWQAIAAEIDRTRLVVPIEFTLVSPEAPGLGAMFVARPEEEDPASVFAVRDADGTYIVGNDSDHGDAIGREHLTEAVAEWLDRTFEEQGAQPLPCDCCGIPAVERHYRQDPDRDPAACDRCAGHR